MGADSPAIPSGTHAPRFWTGHLWMPAALFLAAALAIHALNLDRRIASALFFDAGARHWIGAGTWWAESLIHDGGRTLVQAVGLGALATLAGGLWIPSLRPFRRAAGYVAVALAVCPSVVDLLQLATNMDCPRDLAGFGGTRPYVGLFEPRPAGLPRAACFPGAHASAGFALMAFYFVWRRSQPLLGQAALVAALALGLAFAFGQEARGAHVLSHDLTSAAIDWLLLLGLAELLLRSPAAVSRWVPAAPGVSPAGAGAARSPEHDRRETTHPANARGRRTGLRRVLQRVLPARLPLRPAAAERGRRSGAGGGAIGAREGDAPDRGLSRRVGPVHLDLPDLPPRSRRLHPLAPAPRQAPGADR
jgi:membrane-associated PAP2 superfamily phosphatase